MRENRGIEPSDWTIRAAIYERFAAAGRAPRPQEVAAAAGATADTIPGAYRRLAAAHAIVLDDAGQLWMAHPFSAVPTPFTAEVAGTRHAANCVWDSLGVIELLGGTGTARFPCPDCGEALRVDVRHGELLDPPDLLVHFAVPAARWLEDIGFT